MSNVKSTDILPPLPVVEGEIILHIPGCPGYAISDKGNLWSCSSRRGRLPFSRWRRIRGGSSGPYLGIKMRFRDRPEIRMNVNIAVLLAFRGPRPDGFICRHLDDNPRNNKLSNLVWGTHSENNLDRSRNGNAWQNQGSRNGQSKLSEQDAICIIRESPTANLRLLGERYGVDKRCISCLVRGKTWKHLHAIRLEVYGTASPRKGMHGMQTRHAGCTKVAAEYGIEAASKVAGHSNTKISEVYAHHGLELARNVMRKIG